MNPNDILYHDAVETSWIMTILKLGTFLALLNETIINVAFSNLMAVFSVSANTVQWLTSGYMLMLGILVPITAYLMERLSTRELYLAAISLFLIGTVFAACAPSFPILLVARLVQGLGAGVLMPLLMNTIMVLNSPEKRGSAMGSALLIILFAPAIGPTYAGMVIRVLNWRWIFIIIIPFAILSIVLGWIFLKNVAEKINKKLDLLSFALSTIGFGALLYGINKLCLANSLTAMDISILLVAFATLVAFVLRQLRIPDPLLNVRVFGSSMFSLGMVLITLTYIVLFANFVLMPMFIEKVLGYSVSQAGLAVLPGGILGAILPPIMGRVYDRFGPRVIVPLGFGIMALANFLISRLTGSTSILAAALCYCLIIAGINPLLAACQTNSLNQLSKENYTHGSAIMNTLMMIGSALGSSIFIAIMTLKQNRCLLTGTNKIEAIHSGISFAYIIATVLAIVCIIMSIFFRKKSFSKKDFGNPF